MQGPRMGLARAGPQWRLEDRKLQRAIGGFQRLQAERKKAESKPEKVIDVKDQNEGES